MEAIKYEYEPHSFRKLKCLSWVVCRKCGLVALNNLLTNWSVKMGCNSEDHHTWPTMRSKLVMEHVRNA